MSVLIGVDIGQRWDPTAVCVAEVDRRAGAGRQESHFLVRHLDRLPLGTPYPVARHLGAVGARVARRNRERPVTFPVYFTHGDCRTENHGEVRLGKAYLVTRLQLLLQTGRLHLPRTLQAETLAQELTNYEIRLPPDANDRYGAFSVGPHDDLVTALGLAVQDDEAPQSGFMRAW